ncbi:inactive TPR repeat-containing thioredoxin TTL3 isoform X2 [Andrographis paniculata]|uniref:inactive TPR repeat-containing thioredoxin TTL3 isoform X2 n=1 Tax=Andrographis paniculata TaxID=175694 RepID=UPI0021E966C4|nr:inactive TPR repeat-containing thioredoxin TTL3 isoform X2 [Andrographis paniculata]
MGNIAPDQKKPGCGLLTAVFKGRTKKCPKKYSSSSQKKDHRNPSPDVSNSDRDREFQGSYNPQNHQKQPDRIVQRPGPKYSRPDPVNHPHLHPSHSNKSRPENPRSGTQQAVRKHPEASLGLSGELDSMIADHQRSKGPAGMVRASSGNVMLHGNLGNLKQPGNGNTMDSDNVPRTRPDLEMTMKKDQDPAKTGSLCRALSTRMDPEHLKILGNEDYKNGKFAEALALYDTAISIDPNKACYRSNKSAALTSLGRLLEAAFECREAIRIDPFYQRAHNRLATLLVRLGEAERATYHFKQAGQEADPDSMDKAKQVLVHLNKCTEAKRRGDWRGLEKEAELSIVAGADSAPLIFALKAEALMKLNRLQEAVQTMAKGPKFDTNECTKFFGPIASATLLVTRAQVDMIEDRFDDAISSAQRATSLDPNNGDATPLLRKARAVATARSTGNDLFKLGNYAEACIAYGEGLNHDPSNSVLLGNRAACRCKLEQYDKAIDDCGRAIKARPGHTKARLRRADCYAKMENWDDCIQDCQVVLRECSENEEARKLLEEAEDQLKKIDQRHQEEMGRT